MSHLELVLAGKDPLDRKKLNNIEKDREQLIIKALEIRCFL